MNLLHVISCGVYRDAEKYFQHTKSNWINLFISGLKKYKTYYPDGSLCDVSQTGEHSLSLVSPGFCSDFEFGPDRENWVLMFDFPEFRYDPREHNFFLQMETEKVILQRKLLVNPEELHELREIFAQITRYSGSALLSDRLRADFAGAALFRRFLPQKTESNSPADILRKHLDQDRGHRYSIKEHCQKLEMSPNYLRKIFTDEFGISPGVYRERRQKNDLFSLFTYSNLSFKEIADTLGLKHVQHLNLLTKRYFQCTPGELRMQYRKNLTQLDPH